jgi:hypothetical protein
MSNRNLLASAIDYLKTATSVKIAHLIKFEIPSTDVNGDAISTPAYLTDYMSNITWAGRVYEAGKIKKVGDVRQSQGLTNYKLSIEVEGEDQEELDRGLVENLQTSYVGNEIEVLRAYLDETGAIIPFDADSNGPMQYFIGDITDINIAEGIVSGNSTVTWQCAGKFQDFDLVNGRVTDDDSHRGIVRDSEGIKASSDGAKKLSHQSDTGFQHANQTVNVITQYTTTETKYKMKKRHWWQSDKMVSYEEEVERDLELGVSLSAKFLPKVYGVQKTPGIPVFIDALKNDTSTVYVVYAFTEGEIEAFLDLYIEGVPIICSSSQSNADTVCLGNQAEGHTLSAVSSLSSQYQSLTDQVARNTFYERTGIYQGEGGVNRYIDPIISNTHEDPTVGTAQGEYFTVTNKTGTKWVRFYHGTSDQPACEELVAEAAAGNFLLQGQWASDNNKTTPEQIAEYWDINSRLLDTSYVVLKFGISEEETSVPTLDAVVSGTKVSTYTPELVETPNQYTLNPVWQLRDYMIDDICGGSLKSELIDVESFYEVAAQLDTITNSYENDWLTYWRYLGWKTPNLPADRAVMQCNTLLNSEGTVAKNVKKLLEQFDGTLNVIGGKYHLSTEGNNPTIADLDVTDVIGSIKTKDLSNKNKWNSIQASIVDPGQGWGTTQINFFNKEYLAQDNNIHKKGNIGFSFITNYYTAREWAERELNKSRYSRELSFETYFKYLYLKPNDNITITYNRFKYDKKTFRVKQCTLKANGKVSLTLEDFDESIYSATPGLDTSGEVTFTRPQTLPPRNLEYIALPDIRFSVSIPDNVHGILVWDAPDTANILRYSVRDWQEVTTDYAVPVTQTVLDNGILRNYIFITNLNTIGIYTFKVLSISKSGNPSKYAVVKITNSSVEPVTFPPVENFTSIDTINGEFSGPSISMVWDGTENTAVTTYQINITNGVSTLRNANISAGTETYEYTLANNMSDYGTNNGALVGAYRSLDIRIRATNGLPEGDVNFVSSIWKNLI